MRFEEVSILSRSLDFPRSGVVVSVEMYVAVGEEEKERKEGDRDEGSRR